MIKGDVETKIRQMRMQQFKLTKNLFLSRGCEHMSCWQDGTDFISKQKYY